MTRAKALRIAADLRSKEFAISLGLSPMALTRLEKGMRDSKRHLLLVADYFQVPSTSLMDEVRLEVVEIEA